MSEALEFWRSGRGLQDITPRGVPWPEGPEFKIKLPDMLFAQDVVEFGCGIGRLAPLFSKRRYLGVDICPQAIEIARRQNHGYEFLPIAPGQKITGGHAIFAHSVMMHVPDEELVATIGQFTQKRVLVSEVLGKNWRRGGNPPVFNRDIGDYQDAFGANGYQMMFVRFVPSEHYPGTDLAILEFHRQD